MQISRLTSRSRDSPGGTLTGMFRQEGIPDTDAAPRRHPPPGHPKDQIAGGALHPGMTGRM
jgi:hypothetical protein